MDIGLGDEVISARGTGVEEVLRGRDDLRAGLELGVVRGKGKPMREVDWLVADYAVWTELERDRDRETYSTVEKRTKGEESEKARTAVQANNVAAIESCIAKCGCSALLVGGVAEMQEVPTNPMRRSTSIGIRTMMLQARLSWAAVRHGRTFSARPGEHQCACATRGAPIGKVTAALYRDFPPGKYQKSLKCSPNHDQRRTRYSRLRKRERRYTMSKRSRSTEMHVPNTFPASASASWRGSSRPKKLRRRRNGKQSLR